jgi:macrolide-specific efflux system membrane fusion protein
MKIDLHSKWVWAALATVAIAIVVAIVFMVVRKPVDYVNPRYGPIVEAIYGLGKVKTDRVFEVKLGITKTIEELYVSEGDIVKKDSPLVRFEGGLLFRAPFAGTITNIAFNENQYVFPQQAVVRLEDLSTKYIEVSLEQQGALRVKPGQSVRVVFESIRGEVLTGKVSAIFSRNEEFLAHIEVPLADNILPGMTADVAIEVDRKDKVLLVPLSGISDGRVKVRRDGKTRNIKLKIGSIDGNWAEVVEGDITVEDQIIVSRRAEQEQP